MKKTLLTLVCFGLVAMLSVSEYSQSKVEKKVVVEIKEPGLPADMKSKLAQFLAETNQMSLNLYSNENRISLILKSANLYWKIDEAQSRATYKFGMEEIRKIVMQLDFEMNELEKSSDHDFAKLSLRNEIWFKLAKVNVLTKSLAEFLLAHDPKMCYDFFQDLYKYLTNEQLRKNFQNGVSKLEATLVLKVAEQNLDRAVEIAEKRLRESGFFADAWEVLRLAYQKNNKGTVSLAAKFVNSVKAYPTVNDSNIGLIERILAAGNANLTGLQKSQSKATPIFTTAQLQGIAEVVDRYNSRTDNYANTSNQTFDLIKKFIPSKADNIDKLIERNNDFRKQARAKIVPTTTETSIKGKLDAKALFQAELVRLVSPLSSKTLDSNKKRQAVGEATGMIAVVTDKQYKFSMLIWLTRMCIRGNEKKLAADVLAEAELLLQPSLKSSADFSMAWLIADVYSAIDPSRSIEMVERTTSQLNSIINGFAVLSEFMVGEVFVENGEIKIEGGESSKTLGLEIYKSSLIKRLATIDFERMSQLSNRIERSEFRIEIRLLIARSLLYPPLEERELSLEF
jgi:hypothetical protein